MRTRSSSNLPVVSPPNPSTSNPKRRNRRRSKQPFILEEYPVDTMANQRIMAKLLRAPTEGDNIQGYVSTAVVNYNQGNSVYRPPGSGSLPKNTIANPKGELKAITTRNGIVLDRPTVPTPPPFNNPEEFADELALITFPPEYDDDLQFDIESNLKEIEYLLHHDPIKDIDFSLKDSIDQNNLADLNDNLVDSMPEMFTNEHAFDYSSPPLFD
nr:reverse transcriptase domain-containing protein [Tanacetum cinerariifolium]